MVLKEIRSLIIAVSLLLVGCALPNNQTIYIHTCVCPHTIYEMTSLMDTAQAGDVEQIKKLIAGGEDVNAAIDAENFSTGRCVLRFAIDSKSLDAVTALIGAGARVNALTVSPIMHPDKNRQHANIRNLPLLSHAIKTNAPIDIIKILIQSGADVNQKGLVGDWTPLMVAAYTGNVDAVFALLAAGADIHRVNTRDGHRTALDYAFENGNKQIINIFVIKSLETPVTLFID